MSTKKFRVKISDKDDDKPNTITNTTTTNTNTNNTNDNDDDDIDKATRNKSTTQSSTTSTAAKKVKAKNVLSFGDEAELSVPSLKLKARPDLQVKPVISRSSHSTHTTSRSKEPETAPFANTSTSYTQSELSALKMETEHKQRKHKQRPKSPSDAHGEPSSSATNNTDNNTYDNSNVTSVGMGVGTGSSVGVGMGGGAIPSASEIQAAKQQRQRMRLLAEQSKADLETNDELKRRDEMHRQNVTATAAPAFIPLLEGEPLTSENNAAEHSRLVREDEDDDVPEAFDDHAGSRISFVPKSQKEKRREQMIMAGIGGKSSKKSSSSSASVGQKQKKSSNVIAMEDSIDADAVGDSMQDAVSDDDDEWERSQLMKAGIQTKSEHSISKQQSRSVVLAPSTQEGGIPDYIRAFESGNLPEPMTLQDTHRILQQRVEQMRQAHTSHKRELQKVIDELENVAVRVSTFDTTLAGINKRYMFFQKTRDHILDLLDCLDAKMPEVDAALEKIRDVRRRRRAQQRRDMMQNIRDQFTELKAMIAGGKPPVVEKEPPRHNSNNDNNDDTNNDKDNDNNSDNRSDDNNNSDDSGGGGGVDMFGRDRGHSRTAQRRTRIDKRRKRHQKNREKHGAVLEEGWSSDSEGGSDGEYWNDSHKKVLEKAKTILDEVDIEFSTIQPIKRVLEEWKRSQSQTYKDCYVSLCLPTLFSPFVKSELLSWDPFDTPSIDQFEWYTALFDYGASEDGSLSESDDDFDLIPRIVQYLIVPFVSQCVSDSHVTTSNTHTTALVNLVADFVNYVEPSTPEFKELISQILTSVHYSIDTLPLYYPTTDQKEASLFCRWLFVRSLKLIRNIVLWKEVLSVDVLKRLTMDKITSDKQVPYLKSIPTIPETIQSMEMVLDSYPVDWLTTSTEQLSKLHAVMIRTLSKLRRMTPAASTATVTDIAKLKQMAKLFLRVGDKETSMELCATYGLTVTV